MIRPLRYVCEERKNMDGDRIFHYVISHQLNLESWLRSLCPHRARRRSVGKKAFGARRRKGNSIHFETEFHPEKCFCSEEERFTILEMPRDHVLIMPTRPANNDHWPEGTLFTGKETPSGGWPVRGWHSHRPRQVTSKFRTRNDKTQKSW